MSQSRPNRSSASTTNQLSIVWPLLILVAAGIWFFQAFNGLPAAVIDLMRRSAPILLVALGLMLLLGRRVRYGNLIAVLICLILTGGVIVTAYGQQTGHFRTDYAAPINVTVAPEVTSLTVAINVRQTEIAITPTAAGQRVINGDFLGSLESSITPDYNLTGTVGTFVLNETPRNAIPSLDLMGKGKLTLAIPAQLPIDELKINGQQGNLTLDASQNRVTKLSIALLSGNITVKFAPESGLIGDLSTGSGDVTVEIPPTIAAQITLRGGGSGSPQFNDALYVLDRNGTLVPKGTANPQMQLTIDSPGHITVK